MRFPSESARLEHPQARLIPSSLWNNLTHRWNESDDETLSLMSIDLAAIDGSKVHRLLMLIEPN